MKLTKEEMDDTDRNHFNSIQKKLSQELINA